MLWFPQQDLDRYIESDLSERETAFVAKIFGEPYVKIPF